MLTVRLSTEADVEFLATRLRQADLDELLAAGSKSAHEALTDGLRSPDPCLTAVDEEGTPVVMFGTAPHPLDPLVGCVWLLGSEAIHRHKASFLRQSIDYTRLFHGRYPVLMNFTDKRNTVHHRWLRWLGFVFLRTVPGYGEGAEPFLEFVRLHDVRPRDTGGR